MSLAQETVFLKVDCDFKNRVDKAWVCYGLDGKKCTAIDKPLQMVCTLPHFMDYRFELFNFATRTAGGFVDLDFFRVSDEVTSQ